MAVRLSRRAAGGAWLVVADDGPGFGAADPTRRGQSSHGSTGLGLDIARRIAEASGGTLIIGRSASGGGSVTLGLGSPAGPPEEARRHRRPRLRLRGLPHVGQMVSAAAMARQYTTTRPRGTVLSSGGRISSPT